MLSQQISRRAEVPIFKIANQIAFWRYHDHQRMAYDLNQHRASGPMLAGGHVFFYVAKDQPLLQPCTRSPGLICERHLSVFKGHSRARTDTDNIDELRA